jgi:hypothetical protein
VSITEYPSHFSRPDCNLWFEMIRGTWMPGRLTIHPTHASRCYRHLSHNWNLLIVSESVSSTLTTGPTGLASLGGGYALSSNNRHIRQHFVRVSVSATKGNVGIFLSGGSVSQTGAFGNVALGGDTQTKPGRK